MPDSPSYLVYPFLPDAKSNPQISCVDVSTQSRLLAQSDDADTMIQMFTHAEPPINIPRAVVDYSDINALTISPEYIAVACYRVYYLFILYHIYPIVTLSRVQYLISSELLIKIDRGLYNFIAHRDHFY